jgi:cyclopropane-fatty-acyl-phospholipid synthase
LIDEEYFDRFIMTSVSTDFSHLLPHLKSSWIDDVSFKKIIEYFKRIEIGRLVMTIGDDCFEMGQESHDTELVAYIHVENKAVFRQMMLNGMVGAAEMFMLGAWHTPDLSMVIKIMSLNINMLNEMENHRSIPQRISSKLFNYFKQNTLSGSQKNISAHYDLSNDFFSTFLDPSMMYSSAIFKTQETSLAEAAVYKLDAICQKLELKPSDHLLEIGTGWGGMAIHAAQNYGCKVTTTTISQAQYDFACEKVSRLGLGHQITVLKDDYRDLSGSFDKLVSIEMIEAVGHQFYQSYFERCSSLLKPHGLALIQAITISDQRFHEAKDATDFIQRYIFPGGCLPSVSVIANCIAEYTDMQLTDLHDITDSYVLTLQHWRDAFLNNIDDIKAMGFDDVFCRMWEYYLCYCEGGFDARIIQTSQILLAKPHSAYSGCKVRHF